MGEGNLRKREMRNERGEMRNNKAKFKTVIDKNTFYFSNRFFEEKYEGYLNSIRETLLILKKESKRKD